MPRRKPIDPERSHDLPVHRLARMLTRLESAVYYDQLPITSWQHRRAIYRDRDVYDYRDDRWQPFGVGDRWGGEGVTSFLRTVVTIPPAYRGADAAMRIDIDGGEGLLCLDRRPWQGLDWNRSLVSLAGFHPCGDTVQLDIEAYVINFPYDARRGDQRAYHRLRRAELCRIDRPREAYVHDLAMVLEAYRSYWERDAEPELEEYLLHALTQSTAALGPPTGVAAADRDAVRRAHETLRSLTYESGLFRSPGSISVVAHSHLDLLYLWPLKETLRKNCRSVANALSLMREYPDYRFSWSQPWLYEQLRRSSPELFAEVQQRVAEGRWEPVGAMLVEPDANLPGGESMIRQIALGQRRYREFFGRESQVCWLPDVFGAMYTLPQILRKSGLRYFATVKLTIWNDTNDFPYSSFRWRGPDGSEVLAHFPSSHFGQNFSLAGLRRHWSAFHQRLSSGETMYVYGPADGGGGPTREMATVGSAVREFPGLPAVRIDTVESFFARIAAQADRLPVWQDELYLEAHRGTYTTRADLKALNRRLESRLRNAEIVTAIAMVLGADATRSELDTCWQGVLLNQFHDTLPGTHVPEARAQIAATYDQVGEQLQTTRTASLGWIAQRVALPAGRNDDADLMLLFNTLSWQRRGTIAVAVDQLPAPRVVPIDIHGNEIPYQYYADRLYLHGVDVPAIGWRSVLLRRSDSQVRTVRGIDRSGWFSLRTNGITTPWFQIAWDDDGCLRSIIDLKRNREILAGPANHFVLYDDDPGKTFSAWDLGAHIHEHPFDVRADRLWRVAEHGVLLVVLRASFQVLDSIIRQDMLLYRYERRIEFRTQVDWRNEQKALKVQFPFAITAGSASTHLPFGAIARSTHRNTSWDQAKYEVLMHYWADLSESGFGCALVNDGKYGCSFWDNTIELTLLRSPIYPDPASDRGTHAFGYALVPHEHCREDSELHRAGYEFNVPLEVVVVSGERVPFSDARVLPATRSFLQVDNPRVVIETIKQADDGDGIVIRAYEATGGTAPTTIQLDRHWRATETDLLERALEGGLQATATTQIARTLHPYEICTVHLHHCDGRRASAGRFHGGQR